MPGPNGATPTATRLADADAALAAARAVAAYCAENAPNLDHDDAFPEEEFRRLADAGLLAAPLPRASGGLGLATEAGGMRAALQILTQIGWGSWRSGESTRATPTPCN